MVIHAIAAAGHRGGMICASLQHRRPSAAVAERPQWLPVQKGSESCAILPSMVLGGHLPVSMQNRFVTRFATFDLQTSKGKRNGTFRSVPFRSVTHSRSKKR